jgi:hypothetical protein
MSMLHPQLSPFLQTYRKLVFTLTAVLVTFCMFSNTNKALFIQEGSQVTGLEYFNITASLGIIYVKEKTIFHFDNNTTAKVVYFSTTPILQKGERLLYTMGSIGGGGTKQPTQIISTIAPRGKFPFQRGFFLNLNNCFASLTTPIFKKNKPTCFILKYAYPTKGGLPYANLYSKGIAANYHYCTPHHKIALHRSYYSLPPPSA